MRLDRVAGQARLEALSAETDVCTLLFDHDKTRLACRVFLDWLKDNRRRASQSEISQFTRDLEAGRIKKDFKYTRKNFYRTLRRQLVDSGFLELYYGSYKGKRQWVYAPILQPIPVRPPGGHNFYHMAWQICERWNREWEE